MRRFRKISQREHSSWVTRLKALFLNKYGPIHLWMLLLIISCSSIAFLFLVTNWQHTVFNVRLRQIISSSFLINFNGAFPNYDNATIQRQPVYSCGDHIGPLLVLFTTFKPSIEKKEVYTNTIRNWATLQPGLQPVMFVENKSDSEIIQLAERLGWHVVPVPKFYHSLPILSAMFTDVYARFRNIPFYSFANADILFTADLLSSLCFMLHSVKQMNWTQFLFTGRRLGVTLSHRLGSLPPIEELALNGTLFLGSSADFYVTSANSFPWEGTPPFVVGRITIDNWVIARAMLNMTPVVDLTNTITAVHLTDGKGNYESLGVPDKYLNRDLLPSGFPHRLGSPLCAPFKTLYNVHKRQALYHRRVTFSNCKSTLTDLRLWKNGTYWQNWRNLCSLCNSET